MFLCSVGVGVSGIFTNGTYFRLYLVSESFNFVCVIELLVSECQHFLWLFSMAWSQS